MPSRAEETLAETFAYLARRDRRAVVAIDEFQQILEYPERGTEALLRSQIQFVPGVRFVFAGSRQHLMREMFLSPRQPFYQSTDILSLGPIDRAAYLAFARRHFPLSGKLSVILLFAPLSVLWYGAVALRNGRPGIAWAYLRGTLRGVFSRLPAPPSPIVRSITAKPSDCTIVVAGCDKYADLLAPFSALWRQFWPDCPYRVVLVTETAPTEGKLCFDEVFAMGGGRSWGWRLSHALARLATPRVILLCDDYFLCGRVDTGRIAARVRQSLEADALNLRLVPNPATAEPWPSDSTLGRYRKNTAYCISTLAGIWDREFLAGLSGKTESIWEFERQGSYSFPGDEGRPLLCTREQEFPFVDAVHKGHWEKFGVRLCRERNVPVDLSARTLPPLSRRLVEWAKGVVFRMSPGLIVRTQNRFGLGHKEAKRK